MVVASGGAAIAVAVVAVVLFSTLPCGLLVHASFARILIFGVNVHSMCGLYIAHVSELNGDIFRYDNEQ